jgi:hypothetical protein
MRVSQSHAVASAKDKLVIRIRMLLSHAPNPAPTIVTSEVAVSAVTDEQLMIPFCVGKNANEELNCDTALLSTVNAKLRMLPSEGDWLQVNEVSLSHRVMTNALSPMRARGFEFVLEK